MYSLNSYNPEAKNNILNLIQFITSGTIPTDTFITIIYML